MSARPWSRPCAPSWTTPFAAANAARPDLPPWPTGGEPLDVAHAMIERRLLAHVAELDAFMRARAASSSAHFASSSAIEAIVNLASNDAPSAPSATTARVVPVEPHPHRLSVSTLIATLFLVAMLFFGLVGFFATWGRP